MAVATTVMAVATTVMAVATSIVMAVATTVMAVATTVMAVATTVMAVATTVMPGVRTSNALRNLLGARTTHKNMAMKKLIILTFFKITEGTTKFEGFLAVRMDLMKISLKGF